MLIYYTLHQVKLFAPSIDRTRVFQATYLEVLRGSFSLKRILNVHLQCLLLLLLFGGGRGGWCGAGKLEKDYVSSYTCYTTRRLTMCLVFFRVLYMYYFI